MTSGVNVVIGAGQAGAYAAMAMRDAGFKGRVLLIGDEGHLPYERPPLSKALLSAPEPPALDLFFTADRYSEAGIDLLLGTAVVGLDPKAGCLHLAGGRREGFDRLVLATGSRARRLAIPGAEVVRTVRTAEDARRLRQELYPGARVVCIGAGVISLEVASSARSRGCSVVVIELASAVMARSLSPDMETLVRSLHLNAGVELALGTKPESIQDGKVHCSDGRSFPADVVVAGIGIERNSTLAIEAGLDVADGILTDAAGRTSVPGVYAAGEVAAYHDAQLGIYVRQESWRHAQQHGTIVGRSAAGVDVTYDDVPWFWSDQHGTNIQMAGTHAGSTRTVLRRSSGAGSVSAFYLATDGRVIGVAGLNAGREVAAGLRLIRMGRAIDPAVLADTAISAQKLVAVAST
ncbi:NAD(P)/FAD-dependent oxidoreductase [Muricoccus radiodurans]|uniref:NAD(P)/FAD-dependent oxidoreductase n=1 Tax=Muricoccus radiodurans TaxID=2231721 RepID=UPI003CFBA37D